MTNVWADSVEIDGERIYANTIVWTAGVKANSLGASLGAELDRSGRVKVEPDCSVKGSSNVFVIGDMATINCAKVASQSLELRQPPRKWENLWRTLFHARSRQ